MVDDLQARQGKRESVATTHAPLVDLGELACFASTLCSSPDTLYRTLVEQIPVVAYIEYPDSGGLPHYLSPKIESLLGYPLEVWQEHPGLWIECIHPEDRPAWELEIERTNETGERFDLEYRMIAARRYPAQRRSGDVLGQGAR